MFNTNDYDPTPSSSGVRIAMIAVLVAFYVYLAVQMCTA
jgi:hypothetical protein